MTRSAILCGPIRDGDRGNLAPLCRSERRFATQSRGSRSSCRRFIRAMRSGKRERVMSETGTAASRSDACKNGAGCWTWGFNIDAEEAGPAGTCRWDVIEAVLRDPSLAGWDGFAASSSRHTASGQPTRDRLALRAGGPNLTGRSWCASSREPTGIRRSSRSQVEGICSAFPVFHAQGGDTDVFLYLLRAARCWRMTDRIYPQFATHKCP